MPSSMNCSSPISHKHQANIHLSRINKAKASFQLYSNHLRPLHLPHRLCQPPTPPPTPLISTRTTPTMSAQPPQLTHPKLMHLLHILLPPISHLIQRQLSFPPSLLHRLLLARLKCPLILLQRCQ